MTPASRGSAGFTLIELMVVLVIIGVLMTMVSLSFSADGKGELLQREAKRLQALMALAREEATLGYKAIGLTQWENGYRFLHYSNRQWSADGFQGSPLRERELPPEMAFTIWPEGHHEISRSETERPGVLFWPTGEVTPFEAEFRLKTGESLAIRGEIGGEVELLARR